MNKLLVSLVCLCLAGSVLSQGQVPSCPTGTAGWVWDNQKCEKCRNDWCTCTAYNGCDACVAGYYLDTRDPNNKTCMKCDDSLATSCCADMTTLSAGTYGGAGYTLRSEKCGMTGGANNVQAVLLSSDLGNTGVCFNPGWCKSWTEYGICTGCAAGYYLSENSTCVACKAGCADCNSNDQCNKCSDGFYLDYTTLDNKDVDFPVCQACNTGCNCNPTFPKNYKCSSCMTGWYETDAGMTDENRACAACSTKNAITCTKDTVTTCQAGYVKSADNACTKCPDNCDISATSNCEWKSNAAVCNKCVNAFYPSADKTSCTRCDSSNFNRCNPGATADAPVTIVQCGETATDESSYRTAVPHTGKRYLVSVKGTDGKTVPTCIVNDNSCKMITPTDTDNQACSSCYEDLQWLLTSEKKCKQCQAEKGVECNKCATDGTGLVCTECKAMYWADKDTNGKISACKPCSAIADGCIACTDGTTCTKCAAGYRQTADKKSCEKCTVLNCMTCNADKDKCETCVSGRSLITLSDDAKTQICEKCQASCVTCSPRGTCTACATGYYLSSGKCLKAIANCNAYNLSGGSCDVCAYNYRKVTREDGFSICVSCHNTGLGYVNCFNTCSAQGKKWPYRRDGAEYNSGAEAKRQQTNPNPSGSGSGNGSNSSIFVAQIALFVCMFIAIAF